jgi:hypothetical protein
MFQTLHPAHARLEVGNPDRLTHRSLHAARWPKEASRRLVVAINLSFDSSLLVAPAANVSKENLDYFGAAGQAIPPVALGQRRSDVLGLRVRRPRCAHRLDKRALWTKGRMMPRNASHARMAITLSAVPAPGRRWP